MSCPVRPAAPVVSFHGGTGSRRGVLQAMSGSAAEWSPSPVKVNGGGGGAVDASFNELNLQFAQVPSYLQVGDCAG